MSPPEAPDRRPGEFSPALARVLASAARLQQLVPDAVLVGGAAAALYAGHRESFDHDHVLADLVSRYDVILDAVEASDGWATSVRASRPPVTILGSLDGVRAGLRQLRRARPLEVSRVDIGDGSSVTVPIADEMLRVKSYLILQRNRVRDYLDVVALAEHLGLPATFNALVCIDDYYVDRSGAHGSVLTELLMALADPQPADVDVIIELSGYRGLDPKWHAWPSVVAACRHIAAALAGGDS